MNFLVLGLGVIGSTYGYVLWKAGHQVEHLVRDDWRRIVPADLQVSLLDGRYSKDGSEKTDDYPVVQAQPGGTYDLIIVSVPRDNLASAVDMLRQNRMRGTLLLFCNTWHTREELDQLTQGYDYLLGFPTAGGRMYKNVLNSVLFDHVLLEGPEKADVPCYDQLVEALHDADLGVENPFDMLEWIWLHMAINAAVTVTAVKQGETFKPVELAARLMDSSQALGEAVLAVRETVRIVAARGVSMNNYKSELLPYRMPSWVAAGAMKKVFRTSELTRRIMLLHSDLEDIFYGCSCVYGTGQELGVRTPLFSSGYHAMEEAVMAMV